MDFTLLSCSIFKTGYDGKFYVRFFLPQFKKKKKIFEEISNSSNDMHGEVFKRGMY